MPSSDVLTSSPDVSTSSPNVSTSSPNVSTPSPVVLTPSPGRGDAQPERVDVQYPAFDEDFIIKGNDEAKLRELFASERLRDLIAGQPQIHFEVKDDEGWFGSKFPEGVDELVFLVVGVIKDVERLKLLFDLFAETLDQLCRIGSAYETTTGVELK
jgi:hypothetical protein